MKRSIQTLWYAGVTVLAGCIALQTARADLVFDNSTNDLLLNFNPGANEVGDEILLQGQARYVSSFIFQYYGDNFSGDELARVRFYVNDGPPSSGVPRPGTILYDSGPFSIPATPRSTIILDALTLAAGNLWNPGQLVLVPDSFTWSVQFYNVTGSEEAGVSLYNPPTVGWDYNSYWDNDPLSGWLLKTNTWSIPMNFAARVEAVPEPNAVVLGLGGALLVLLLRASIRRRNG